MPEERISPPVDGMTVEYEEHIARYRFAADFVKRDSVGLDIACGTGYGTDVLAKKGARVFYGVDISAEAIDYAKKNFKDPALSFILSDALEVKFNPGQFDIITSFETIEHLQEGMGDVFVQKLHSLLKKGGTLVLSCPNRDTYPAGYNKNIFHIYEYSFEEIKAIVMKYFPDASIYCQEMLFFKRSYKKFAQFTKHLPGWMINFLVAVAKRGLRRNGLHDVNIFMRIILYTYYLKYDVVRFVEDYNDFKPVFAVFVCTKT